MSEEQKEPKDPPKHKVRADPNRVMSWVDIALSRRPLLLVFVAQLIILLALLLGPRLWSRDTALTRLRVGDRAEGNLKASRTFDYYPSSEKVEKERAVAAGKILPVFDHQTDLGAVLLSRVGKAFTSMVSTADASIPTFDGGAANPEALTEEKRKQFTNILQTEVSPEVFRLLQKTTFSSEIRASLLALLGSATSQLVVAHRGALIPFEGSSIAVRHMVGGRLGSGGEEKVSNFGRIKDLQQVREEIRVQSTVHAAKLTPALGKVVVGLAQNLVMPNMAFNQEETESRREGAREGIQPRPISFIRGQVIVRDGDPIAKEHLAILKAMEGWQGGADVVQVLVGLAFFILITLSVVFRYASKQFRRFLVRPRDLLAISVLLLGLLGLARFAVAGGEGWVRGQDLPIILYAIPIAGGPMLVRLLISAEAAALFATVLAALCGIMVDQSLGMMLFYFVTGLVGASGVTQVQSRSTILRAGFAAGVAGALMVLGFRMFREQVASVDTLYMVLATLAGGVLASFLTLALLPAMEWLFAYTTDVSLLELANLNHPLLRELILRAPGTYHHSMVVGSLSEAACEAIGANGLLARVACYYHDIGKMKNADYFAENFRPGENPHNRLKPSMSALIIRSHVKDTLEMLREHGVPELVIETATQHHGQTLMEFFYHKAGEVKEEGEEVHEEDYRYPGPKPQTREAGIIMLADAVEAAARSLAESSEDRLVGVVQRVTNSKFTDGQLDHCDLTLRDLHLIAKAFLQVLRGIYHQRPSYPWQHQQQQRKDETRRGDQTRRDTAPQKAVERPDATDKAGKAVKKDEKKAKPDTKADKTEKKPSGGKGKDEQVTNGKAKAGKDEQSTNGKAKDEPKHESSKAAEGKERERKRTGEVAAVARDRHTGPFQAIVAEPAEPPGDGKVPPPPEPPSPPEAETEGGQDLRRLGL
jgi:cyclic-di-AMP phosphodiesterase PgpH